MTAFTKAGKTACWFAASMSRLYSLHLDHAGHKPQRNERYV
jgi:hypothetical protein